jgi:hypothetical protein
MGAYHEIRPPHYDGQFLTLGERILASRAQMRRLEAARQKKIEVHVGELAAGAHGKSYGGQR